MSFLAKVSFNKASILMQRLSYHTELALLRQCPSQPYLCKLEVHCGQIHHDLKDRLTLRVQRTHAQTVLQCVLLFYERAKHCEVNGS